VIDYIDMSSGKHQRAVEDRLQSALRHDRARVQIGKISRFGLLEMSRQRLRASLGESSQIVCPRCEGHGRMRSIESLALSIIRVAEEHAMKDNTGQVLVQAPVEIANYLLNEKRRALSEIEGRHDAPIVIVADEQLHTPHYEVTRLRENELGEETARPSYQRGTPRKLATIALTKANLNVPPPAAVTNVRPAQPAPMREPREEAPVAAPAPAFTAPSPAATAARSVGLWDRIVGFFGGGEPAAPARTPQQQPERGGRADRNERGGQRRDGRGGDRDRNGGRNRDGQRRDEQRRGGQQGQQPSQSQQGNRQDKARDQQQPKKDKQPKPQKQQQPQAQAQGGQQASAQGNGQNQGQPQAPRPPRQPRAPRDTQPAANGEAIAQPNAEIVQVANPAAVAATVVAMQPAPIAHADFAQANEDARITQPVDGDSDVSGATDEHGDAQGTDTAGEGAGRRRRGRRGGRRRRRGNGENGNAQATSDEHDEAMSGDVALADGSQPEFDFDDEAPAPAPRAAIAPPAPVAPVAPAMIEPAERAQPAVVAPVAAAPVEPVFAAAPAAIEPAATEPAAVEPSSIEAPAPAANIEPAAPNAHAGLFDAMPLPAAPTPIAQADAEPDATDAAANAAAEVEAHRDAS
jgi:ribonuclease E